MNYCPLNGINDPHKFPWIIHLLPIMTFSPVLAFACAHRCKAVQLLQGSAVAAGCSLQDACQPVPVVFGCSQTVVHWAHYDVLAVAPQFSSICRRLKHGTTWRTTSAGHFHSSPSLFKRTGVQGEVQVVVVCHRGNQSTASGTVLRHGHALAPDNS